MVGGSGGAAVAARARASPGAPAPRLENPVESDELEAVNSNLLVAHASASDLLDDLNLASDDPLGDPLSSLGAEESVELSSVVDLLALADSGLADHHVSGAVESGLVEDLLSAYALGTLLGSDPLSAAGFGESPGVSYASDSGLLALRPLDAALDGEEGLLGDASSISGSVGANSLGLGGVVSGNTLVLGEASPVLNDSLGASLGDGEPLSHGSLGGDMGLDILERMFALEVSVHGSDLGVEATDSAHESDSETGDAGVVSLLNNNEGSPVALNKSGLSLGKSGLDDSASGEPLLAEGDEGALVLDNRSSVGNGPLLSPGVLVSEEFGVGALGVLSSLGPLASGDLECGVSLGNVLSVPGLPL